MPERKIQNDFAETAVLPEYLRPDRVDTLADAATEHQVCYQEYVRALDEVPVLVDVVREAPRVPVRDFRLGQRPDVRKAPRDDAAALREQHASELARHYHEYVRICAGLAGVERAGPKKTARKHPGPKKKRAKRAKRSARSTS